MKITSSYEREFETKQGMVAMAVNIAVQVPLIIYSDFAYDLSTFMTKPNSYSPFRIAKSLRWLKLSDL